MPCIVVRLYPDGRVERSEVTRSLKDRELLLGYALYLQPGLAALDVGARLWVDLSGQRSRRRPRGNAGPSSPCRP
jgi:hypothetical protein